MASPETQTQAQSPQAQTNLVRIDELQKVELKTYRLYSSNGHPLPLFVRYMGGAWWAMAPARGVHAVRLPGPLAAARSVMVTADSPREAATALWELLDRIGVCIPYPELAGPA